MHCALIVPKDLKKHGGGSVHGNDGDVQDGDEGNGAGADNTMNTRSDRAASDGGGDAGGTGGPIVGVDDAPAVATIRVGTETMAWREGQCFVFDESCEHEVFIAPSASHARVVLILDFANPFLLNEKDYFNAFARGEDAAAAIERRKIRNSKTVPNPTRGDPDEL